MEPKALREGKSFHRRVQADWRASGEGSVHVERGVRLGPTPGTRHVRRGRLDIFVDSVGTFVVVVEIKSTNWDRIKARNAHRLLSSHRRQVWRYIDKHLNIDRVDVVPGIIYPRRPRAATRAQEVESYLNEWGLQVVWYDG